MSFFAKKRARRLLLARRALHNYRALPPAEQVELLLAAAEVLPTAEAEEAKHTAFALQAAENQQMKLAGLLGLKP